jgi:hypothetical protein
MAAGLFFPAAQFDDGVETTIVLAASEHGDRWLMLEHDAERLDERRCTAGRLMTAGGGRKR